MFRRSPPEGMGIGEIPTVRVPVDSTGQSVYQDRLIGRVAVPALMSSSLSFTPVFWWFPERVLLSLVSLLLLLSALVTRREFAPLVVKYFRDYAASAPAPHRSPTSAPAPAHTVLARPGRRRRRTGWRASCGSLGSRRCDVGPDPTAGWWFNVRNYGSRGCAASQSRTRRCPHSVINFTEALCGASW